MKKIFDWIKNNKVILIIIGTIAAIFTAIGSAFLIFLGIKDLKESNDTNNVIKDTETEIKTNNEVKNEIQNNVNNSSNTVNDIKSKVF